MKTPIKSHTPMNSGTNPVNVRLLDGAGALTEPITVPKVVKSDDAWRLQLTDEQFRVTRTAGTERAFCGIFHDNHKLGLYTCAACGLPLFRSDAKFESGTGWPSFFQPVAAENIGSTRDTAHGMVRTEVHCVRCDSHLGHVFEDGPAPTNLRYCINSAALLFREDGVQAAREKVIFGAGCFWGVETTFAAVEGVTFTRAGYSGGTTKNPTYEDVCSHGTGDAEVVEVEYDPAQLGIDQLLEVFWKSNNPATRDRQGPDTGSQYRSAIFFTNARAGSRGARLCRKARCKRHAPRTDHHTDRVRRAVLRGRGASSEISCEARRILPSAGVLHRSHH